MKFNAPKIALATLLCATALVSAAQTWPERTIRFVVPFGPGGANDLVARAVAEATSRQLGQAIVIDNRPGAGSVLGADRLRA